MRYSDFEDELLVAIYEESLKTPNKTFRSSEILDQYALSWREGWVHQAIAGLGGRDLIRGRGVVSDERNQPLDLTPAGLREAERLIKRGIGAMRLDEPEPAKGVGYDEPASVVPASDRLVPLDHNNPAVGQAILDTNKLAADLRTTNDVGNLSAQEVEVAIEEVTGIGQSLKGVAIRMPAFGRRVRSTLEWVGKEAAGALVGAAALALLALILSIIGA